MIPGARRMQGKRMNRSSSSPLDGSAVRSPSKRTPDGKATSIRLLDFTTPPMRAFHLSWWAFFVCFVAWFGIAPLMAIVRDDLHLTKGQIGNTVIASVTITVIARILTGWLCDRFGPRRTYTALLLIGALPVMGIGLAHSYHSFLLFRLAIGLVGASFVITQHHTSVMFAPGVVGTANATSAGWGNLGGGVAQWLMPLLAGAIVSLGADRFLGWRLAMVVPGIGMLLTGVLYYCFTQDTPDGRPFERRAGAQEFLEAAADYRVWILFLLYAACFGVELTIDNVAALYFKDSFHVGLMQAGLFAGATGMMNVFARSLGGIAGDSIGNRWGLRGRSLLLGLIIFAEGLALMLFSRLANLSAAAAAYLLFGLLVCMACGATYAVVPLIRPRAIGSVSGIVGAGGNAGAVLAGFLFKSENISTSRALDILGIAVVVFAFSALLLRFREAKAPQNAVPYLPQMEAQPGD
jgi:MFS transporter, NNP family, nitrate/nitrite transporter